MATSHQYQRSQDQGNQAGPENWPGHWMLVAEPGSAHIYRKTPKGLERIPDAAAHCSHPFPGDGHEKRLFLHDLAVWLDRAERESAFERLALIAAPEVLETLVSCLRENVRCKLCAAHHRDVAHLTDEENEDHLTETMWL